ncbi:Zinc finger protein on ecdysone puffs-like, partial [Homarus americanus]
MPERYHIDTSFGSGSRRDRSGGMQRARETIDYGHGSSFSAARYRDGGGYGGAGSSSSSSNYGLGNSSSSYGPSSNYGSTSSYGGASSYDGPPSYSHSYNVTPNYGGNSSYGSSGYSSGQMVSPWETGMAPASVGINQGGYLPTPRGSSGGMMESGGPPTSNIVGAVNQLTQMGSTESKLALNILNAVLSTGPGDEGHPHNVDIGPPANKMRRMERDGGHGNHRGRTHSPPVRPPPVRKFPQRDQQYNPRRSWDNTSPHRGRGGYSYGTAGRLMVTNYQLRKTAKAKRGKPRPDTKENKGPAKNQKKVRSEATPAATAGTAGGQKGDKSEGDGSSASAGPKKSETKDDPKNGTEETEEAADDAENTEAMDTTENDEDKDMKAKKEAFVPREILKCHMCDVDNFYSINCYQKHLDSKAHKTTANAYHEQGASILEVLRAEAKLACQRQILKAWKNGARGNLMTCGKCQCKIAGSLQDHNKSVVHSLVAQYLKVKCCGHAYTIRGALEEHRLSLLHFKWQMEMEQEMKEREEKKMEVEGVSTEEDALQMFYDAVEKYKANNCEEEVTSDTIPPYDPAVPVGLHMIGTKSHYRCKVCPGPRFRMVDEQ